MNSHIRTPCGALQLLAVLALAAVAWPAAAADGQPERVITVSGRGEVTAMPERAQLGIGVEARRDELNAAREEVNRGITEFLRFARSLGIEDRHLNATRITVRPEYDWDPDTRQRRFAGYYVARQIEIDLRDLELLGQLIEGAVDRGINQVGDPVLQVADREALRRQALARAAEQARQNASVLAGALDATVGPIRRIVATEERHGPIVPMPGRMVMAMEASVDSAADSYAAGELRFEAHITAEFDLQP